MGEKLLDNQPAPDMSGRMPLDAAKAIKLALESVETGDGPGVKTITSLRLSSYSRRKAGGAPGDVPFYHIAILADGSEVERLVLMDGSVVASRLEEVKGR